MQGCLPSMRWGVYQDLGLDGIASILSLHLVKSKGFQVDYNSAKENLFVVTKKDGTTHKFTPSPNRLYYVNTLDEFQQGKKVCFVEEVEAHDHEDHDQGTVPEVERVLENKSTKIKQGVHKTELARKLQQAVGHLSEKQLMEIAQKNQLKNSPIIPRDVRLMQEISGPSVPGLRGKR